MTDEGFRVNQFVSSIIKLLKVQRIPPRHSQQRLRPLTKAGNQQARKPNVTAVIGEDCKDTRPVFVEKARECGSKIVFAQDDCKILSSHSDNRGRMFYETEEYPELETELQGFCQSNNANTILHSVSELRRAGWILPEEAVRKGFANVCRMTGLRGRWQTVATAPLVICDTGHNSHGLRYTADQLRSILCCKDRGKLRIVFGMVSDKDIDNVLALMPSDAVWYFTQASVKRALPSETLRAMAAVHGHKGRCFHSVQEAFATARDDASPQDVIFVGGSTFVVSDLMSLPEFC